MNPPDDPFADGLPTLAGTRVRLRALELCDAPDQVPIYGDPEVRRFGFSPPMRDETDGRALVEEAARLARERKIFHWCVADLDDDRAIGHASLFHLERDRARRGRLLPAPRPLGPRPRHRGPRRPPALRVRSPRPPPPRGRRRPAQRRLAPYPPEARLRPRRLPARTLDARRRAARRRLPRPLAARLARPPRHRRPHRAWTSALSESLCGPGDARRCAGSRPTTQELAGRVRTPPSRRNPRPCAARCTVWSSEQVRVGRRRSRTWADRAARRRA